MLITPGQRADCTQFEPVVEKFDKERYKKRNAVERAINKLKQFRAVDTRYDKRGYIHLGTVTAAALIIWLRS